MDISTEEAHFIFLPFFSGEAHVVFYFNQFMRPEYLGHQQPYPQYLMASWDRRTTSPVEPHHQIQQRSANIFKLYVQKSGGASFQKKPDIR